MTENSRHRLAKSRQEYAELFGPTTGDRIRLADTDLWIQIEKDYSGGPGLAGDEAVFGGGKVLRESMGQSLLSRKQGAPDAVITGVVIVDHWGIVKADVGIRDGRIVALGKAGNPDTMDGIHPKLIIGPETEIIAGNGKILTAGAVDTHVHFVDPQVIPEALGSGVTTLIGGGAGPGEGSKATTVTPGAWYLARMFEALDAYPVNIGLTGKGSTVNKESMRDQLRAGAFGFKIHEDWGATPAVIDAALQVCDETGAQLALHADTLNEAGYVQSTLAAIKRRGIHVYHAEGAGGGHAPDIITVASHLNVLPSSTNPSIPYTYNTEEEHLDMLMVAHHLNPNIPEDLAFAVSRIRPATMLAEDILHDLGAISMTSSDAQAMGRAGETILRTWQLAHVMKQRRGTLPGDDSSSDNHRVRRYVAKYTINPAITHGVGNVIGSVAQGKLADLVLWEPKFFGVRPHLVIKGGQIAYAQLGDANASIPTPQPVLPRPAYGAVGRAPASLSLNFVTHMALEDGLVERLGVAKAFHEIEWTRNITKADMKENDAMPDIVVKPDKYQVTIDGKDVDKFKVKVTIAGKDVEEIVEEPAQEDELKVLPLAQRYFIV